MSINLSFVQNWVFNLQSGKVFALMFILMALHLLDQQLIVNEVNFFSEKLDLTAKKPALFSSVLII